MDRDWIFEFSYHGYFHVQNKKIIRQIKMNYFNFDAKQQRRSLVNKNGFFEACTAPTQYEPHRPKNFLHAPYDFTCKLGAGVQNGQFETMSGNMKRLSQNALLKDNLDPNDLPIQSFNFFAPNKIKKVKFIRRFYRGARIYSKSYNVRHHVVTRLRTDMDTKEVVIQYAILPTCRSEFLNNSSYRDISNLKFPKESDQWFKDFVKLNNFTPRKTRQLLQCATRPSQKAARVPILECNTWIPEFVDVYDFFSETESSAIFLKDIVCFNALYHDTIAICHWPEDCEYFTTEAEAILCQNKYSLQTIFPFKTKLTWQVKHRDAFYNLVNFKQLIQPGSANFQNSQANTFHLQSINQSPFNLGFIYTTDFGISTGVPLTHSNVPTPYTTYDGPYETPVQNMFHDTIFVKISKSSSNQSNILNLLKALQSLTTQSHVLLIHVINDDVILRSLLMTILKVFPVHHASQTVLEHQPLLRRNDTLSVLLNEIFLNDTSYPLIENTQFKRAFKNATKFKSLKPSNLKNVLVETEKQGRSINCAELTASYFNWSASTSLVFKKKTFLNQLVPIKPSEDNCITVDSLLEHVDIIPILCCDDNVRYLENRKFTHPCVIASPVVPVYHCTNKVKHQVLMRPFPTRDDLESMIVFCSTNARLFTNM